MTVEVRRAFRYRLRPTAAQRTALARAAGARRFAYNWALRRWLDHYGETGRTISRSDLSAQLTALKREPGHEWLREVDSQLLQQALVDLRRAFDAFFGRRAGFPRFASRKAVRQSFRIPQRVRLRGSTLYVPKVGEISLRLSRPLVGRAKGATFVRDADGYWYVSIVAETEVPAPPLSEPKRPVGIDMGVADLVVTSDGQRTPAPRYDKREARRLRRRRRALSRKERGSGRWYRELAGLATLERKVARRRRDSLHKLSAWLVREYDLICIEDLGVTGLARTKLARALHDASLGELRRQLQYKSQLASQACVVVDRFFPSSKRCSVCGQINESLRPRVRRWRCECGAIHDRDINAALNLLEAGLTEVVAVGRTDTENARRARVSLPLGAVNGEAGTRSAVPARDVNMEVLCHDPTEAC
jgi:putative transposase